MAIYSLTRLVEEADYKSTKELFGRGKDEKNLDTFIPKSKSVDAKDIASSVTAIANEKIKAEKEANAGKKKTLCCDYILGGKKSNLMPISCWELTYQIPSFVNAK
ncbi:eukaryotic translation initiation factor 3 subunit J [Spatholobus suberectus]|nr:eukaryotic translation initiation factor 3 subunit J [Spatholobus suberectus]